MSIEVPIEKIKIDQDLYPRDSIDQNQVNLYRQNLEALPPIILSNDYILIDGAHRLQAYEIESKKTINAELIDIPKDKILIESIRYNSKHGKQLTLTEKKRLARLLIQQDPKNGKDIADILAVNSSSIRKWTKDIRLKGKIETKDKILKLYLQCKTQNEISELVDVPRQTIGRYLHDAQNGIDPKMGSPDSLQYYDYWYFSTCDPTYGTTGYPGRVAGQILENYLYYYTQPFEIVVDPMAGGGTTGDVCKSMYRRYQLYDLHPLKTRSDINKHDITIGYPDNAKNCHAVFLDPPYWMMKDKQYKSGSSSGFSREKFIEFIAKLAKDTYDTLRPNGFCGFLFQDVMPKVEGLYVLPEREKEPIFTADLFKLFIDVGFKRESHISTPLSTQQYTGSKVALAKEKKVILHINRDFYVFKKK